MEKGSKGGRRCGVCPPCSFFRELKKATDPVQKSALQHSAWLYDDAIQKVGVVEGTATQPGAGIVDRPLPKAYNNKKPEQKVLGRRRTWKESEQEAKKLFPKAEPQLSFKDGELVRYGLRGSVRPDLYGEGRSIEVKNYNLSKQNRVDNLVRTATKQYEARATHLPEGTKQILCLDIGGQSLSPETLVSIQTEIQKRCKEYKIIFMR